MGNLKSYHYALIYINVAIVIYMFIFLGIKYGGLPDEVPSHYNFEGEVDSYAGKGVLFVLPIVSTFITILFTAFCFMPDRFWKINIGLQRIEMPPEIRSSVIHLTVTFLNLLSTVINAFLAYTLNCMVYSWRMSVALIILFVAGIFLSSISYIVILFIKINPLLSQ
ncbi:hypothetical protein PIROE2DRAFT_58709 [Piromyces sp. E2]|nr:hypothetical protein PIROE2DRAFT_58709 [Piromyces sp. E2]|eukprot:OUM67577.1 hypothetical protein PIROE2DRAFT_58709 [Piromyces sp. E2]